MIFKTRIRKIDLSDFIDDFAASYVNHEQNHFISFHSIYYYAVNKYFKHLLINFCTLAIGY